MTAIDSRGPLSRLHERLAPGWCRATSAGFLRRPSPDRGWAYRVRAAASGTLTAGPGIGLHYGITETNRRVSADATHFSVARDRLPDHEEGVPHMSDKKTIAVIGATGAQGGGLVRAILADPNGGSRCGDHAEGRFRQGACAGRGGRGGRGRRRRRPGEPRARLRGRAWRLPGHEFLGALSAERELKQAAAMARATKAAGVAHAVWSTLEDTRLPFPLDDPRLKTLQGKYKVPHFDAKGEADAIFAAEAAPTSYMMAAFYWENFIYFGQGPRKGADGRVLALPLGGGKLPGIAAEDIGRCAYGIFRRGPEVAGQRFGIAGEVLSGPEYAAAFSRHLGVPVAFYDMPFDDYRALGFPGADDMGNMYEHHAILGEEFRRHRSPRSRAR